jgi:hypothetical protein
MQAMLMAIKTMNTAELILQMTLPRLAVPQAAEGRMLIQMSAPTYVGHVGHVEVSEARPVGHLQGCGCWRGAVARGRGEHLEVVHHCAIDSLGFVNLWTE